MIKERQESERQINGSLSEEGEKPEAIRTEKEKEGRKEQRQKGWIR